MAVDEDPCEGFRPEVELGQGCICVDVIPYIQHFISVQPQGLLNHSCSTPTVQAAVCACVHGGPHEAVFSYNLVQAHLAVEELRLACLDNHLHDSPALP